MPPPHHVVLVMLHMPALDFKALRDRVEDVNRTLHQDIYCGNKRCEWQGQVPRPSCCPSCGSSDIRHPKTPWTLESFILDTVRDELGLPSNEG